MASKYEQALALSKQSGIGVPEAVAQIRNQAPVSATSAGNQMQYEINKQNRQNMANAGEIPKVGTSATPQAGQTQAPTPPPVTPPAPTPTPSGATLDANGVVTPKAEVTPTAPVTPVTPTPVSTPTVPTEVKPEPVKPVTAKVEPTVDFNKSQGREQEIQANIKQITTDNPALLKDRNAYNQAFGYETADAGKKAMLDASFSTGNQVPTASAMYNAIVAKADIPEDQKLTPSYKIAQNRYTKANMFSGMTPSQLANEMKNVKLVEGSQTFEDLKAMNPKLVQDATNLRKVNGGTSNIWTYTNNPDGTPVKVNNLEKTFADDFNDNFGEFIKSMYKIQTPDEIRAMIYTADVRDAEDKAKAIELDINKIDDALDQVDKDVESELAGTGATGSRIALEKASRKDKLNTQRASLERNYTTYANKANNLITQNTSVFQTQQQQKQAQNAAMLPFITDKYKTEQEKIKAQEALQDPATAIKSVMDEYKKLGIPFTSTVQSRLAEFKASGKPLEQFLTEMSQNIQQSPAYKQYESQQKAKGISYQTVGGKLYKIEGDSITDTGISAIAPETAKAPDWKQDASGNWYNANSPYSPAIQTGGVTGDIRYLADQYPGQAWAKNNNPAGITWNTGFDKGTGTAKLLADAGISFTKGTARPPAEGGNYVTFATIEDGLKAQQIIMSQTYGNSTVGQMLSSWVGTKEGPNYAKQVAGMAGVDTNAKVSSLTPEQLNTLQMAKIQKESPGLAKLLKGNQTTKIDQNTPIAQLGQFMKDNQQRGPGYSEEDVKAFNEKIDRFVKNGDEKGIAMAYRNNIFQDKDFKQEFDNTKKFTTALDTVQKLVNDYEAAGKSTNALKGMAEKMYRSLGITQDQALAQLQTQMGFTLANYIKSISGTAASDVEVQRLMGNMANISNAKDLNTTILNQVKSNADSSLKSMIDTRMYGMPDELKQKVFGDVYGTPNTQKNEFLDAIKGIGAGFQKAISGIK